MRTKIHNIVYWKAFASLNSEIVKKLAPHNISSEVTVEINRRICLVLPSMSAYACMWQKFHTYKL